MKRVAALYLPNWPIDRLRRAERSVAPPPELRIPASAEALAAAAAAEQEHACSVPRGGGWRPGARWARQDVKPARHELGRREEPAGNPFQRASARGSSSPRAVFDGGRDRPTGVPPLVTSLRTGNRLLIGAACPQAHALGLQPGMAITQARAQVPGLDIRPADLEADAAELHRMAIVFARRWSPVVALAGPNGLFLDLSGVAHLFGGEAAMGQRIVRLLARLGFGAHIAIADTAGAAWALVRHSRQPVTLCPFAQHEAAIASLPVTALRVDEAAVELLKRLGIDRVGELAAIPRAPLVRRFGHAIATRIDQALGRIAEPLDPVVPPERILVGQRFAEPIGTAEAIEHWLGQLVPKLASELERAGLGARAVELVADRIDGVPQRIRIGLARPSRDPVHLLRLLVRRIETVEPGYGIDALDLYVRRADPLEAQPFAERLDEEAAPDLSPLVDTLATRVGMAQLWRCQPVESDVPERSVARAPVLDPPERAGERRKIDDVRQLARSEALPPWHPVWPRPLRLLARPEQVDNVMAELPDHPPRRFTWRGVSHRIVRADGPERIHGEWWKRSAEAASVRDYFRVEDEEGRRYWLFRRGDGERTITGDMRWYLHGVFG